MIFLYEEVHVCITKNELAKLVSQDKEDSRFCCMYDIAYIIKGDIYKGYIIIDNMIYSYESIHVINMIILKAYIRYQ